MWRAGESTISYRTSVLDKRRKGEQPTVLKQGAGVVRSLVALKLLLSRSQNQAQQRVTSVGTGCTVCGGAESCPDYLSLTWCVLILASCSLGSSDAQTFPTYALEPQ